MSALIANRLANWQLAKADLRAFLGRNPGNVPATALLTRLVAADEGPAAGEAVLAALPPDTSSDPEVMLAQATLLEAQGHVDAAIAKTKAADAANNSSEVTCLFMFRLLTRQGHFEEAAGWLERLTSADPNIGTPYLLASKIRTFKPGTPMFASALARADDPSIAQSERAQLHLALGAAYRAAKEHEKSFHHFSTGNALVDRIYLPAEAEREFRDRMRVTGTELEGRETDRRKGSNLIFVVGMPRSGSTLAAQILAAYPRVTSIGESNAFSICIAAATEVGVFEAANDFGPEFFSGLAERYIEALPDFARDADIIVDKALFKFSNLGLLSLIFPGAQIVHSARDLRDTCFSLFCQYFDSAHSYAYRQDTLAHFSHLYEKAMTYWNAQFGDRIYPLSYEAMIADTEGETRRLLDAVGLGFHPDCLNFRETEGNSWTASVYQVRQGLYASSVGAWKRHEAELQPLSEGLKNKPFQDFT